jgi:hypothetical protein
MAAEAQNLRFRPTHYVCPSCHLYLMAWDPPSKSVEMFHKVGLWSDFWTGHVRLICQYCLGATDVIPEELVDLLHRRFALGTPPRETRRIRA